MCKNIFDLQNKELNLYLSFSRRFILQHATNTPLARKDQKQYKKKLDFISGTVFLLFWQSYGNENRSITVKIHQFRFHLPLESMINAQNSKSKIYLFFSCKTVITSLNTYYIIHLIFTCIFFEICNVQYSNYNERMR